MIRQLAVITTLLTLGYVIDAAASDANFKDIVKLSAPGDLKVINVKATTNHTCQTAVTANDGGKSFAIVANKCPVPVKGAFVIVIGTDQTNYCNVSIQDEVKKPHQSVITVADLRVADCVGNSGIANATIKGDDHNYTLEITK